MDEGNPVLDASLLAALVATLLPGADGWPGGAAVGAQFALATRLVEQRGEAALEQVLAVLRGDADRLLRHDEAAVAAWEARDPKLFGWVRDAAFMAYYESPLVASAINAHGHPYQLRPHIAGYKLPRFDPDRDTPTHRRGRYIATADVVRVRP